LSVDSSVGNLRGDGTNHVEDLKQHGLGDSVVEFTDIEGSAGTSSSGLTSGSRGRLSLSLVGSLRDRGRGRRGRGSFFDFRHFWLYMNFEVGLDLYCFVYVVWDRPRMRRVIQLRGF
jgi:hypothetical protein